MILAVLSSIPQHANRAPKLSIAGGHRPALTVGPQILAGIETETRDIPNAAHRTPLVFRSVRLCSIFDHNQVAPPRYFHDGIHVGRLTVKMHGKDRDRKSTRLNSSHLGISYAVFCLKKK